MTYRANRIPPPHKHRYRSQPIEKKHRIAVAQSTASRYREQPDITLPKEPWKKDDREAADEVDNC